LKFDKTEISALIVLFVGVILLVFAFLSAYGFLSGTLSILASSDLTELFGNAMAPLVEAIIRILYLGIMGWIGSILTIRGVQLLKLEKEAITPQSQVKLESRQSANPGKIEPKPDAKKADNSEKTPTPEQLKESEKEAQPK